MRVLHLNAGTETGGGMHHILNLLSQFSKKEIVLGLFEKGEMYHRAKLLGIPTKLFNQRGQKDLSILIKLVNYIRKENFTFVHTHGPRATFFMSLIKRYIPQPLITTIHSNPCDDFLGKGLKGKLCYLLYRLSFKSVDHFVVVSTAFANIMKSRFNIPEQDISVILNGINFDINYEPYSRDKLNFSENDFLIIMPARLEPVKQHGLAIEAFAKVLKKYDHAKLILVGEGTYRKQIEEMIEKKKLSNNIYLLGHRNDLQKILPIMDLLLLTSKSESFPLVLLEAARAKVPIVTTNVGDVEKLIPTKEFGWIVEQAKCERIAQSIIEAIELKEKQKTETIALKLYKYASNHFSLKHFYHSVRQIYITLIESAK